jgi:hypothetical protein
MYPGPSCRDRPSSGELSAVVINTRIHKVLDLGANLNPGAGPAPLHEGFASTRVSMFGPVLAVYATLSFNCARDLMQGLRGAHSKSWAAYLPEDAVRWEARHTSSGMVRAQREREVTNL